MELSKYAKDALRTAKNFARKKGSAYVGTEHLLIGIAKTKNSVGSQTLLKYKVDLNELIDVSAELLGINNLNDDKIFNSFRLDEVLKQAEKLAIQNRSELIGTEHLLLAMTKDEESAAAKCLLLISEDIKDIFEELSLPIENLSEESHTENSEKQGNDFLKDLTDMGKENKLDPVLGRDKEISRLIEILSRRTKNNPCLVGAPGVGKTAIVEGLAIKISAGTVPEILKNKKILSMDIGAMLAGTKYRGEFEERMKGLIKKVEDNKDIILFMDEVHTIIGAGGSEGSVDAANMLKPALSRGNLQLIGATTTSEYRKYIEKDLALERRFQPMDINEPDDNQCIDILKGIKKVYEVHHNVSIADDLLPEIIALTKRYIPDRSFPDKAIDVLDEACAKVNLNRKSKMDIVNKLRKEHSDLEELTIQALVVKDIKEAKNLHSQKLKLQKKIKSNLKSINALNNNKSQVTIDEITQVISRWSKVPISKLEKSEIVRLKNLEELLKKRLVGQKEAIETVSRAIKRGRLGLKSPNRPIGSFLFLGPTGVGKTELTKAVSEILFDTEESLIRIDMSEYMEKQSVSKLIGSPPGYVGYGEGGQLTDKVRSNPYSVVLFDEVEKAHPDVFNVLLQILDEGHVTDSKGLKVDFKNTIIIMTSNTGAKSIVEPKELGFVTNNSEYDKHERMKKKVMDELKLFFKPEFLNRIDDIVVFKMLEDKQLKQIVDRLTDRFIEHVRSNIGMNLEIDDSVKLHVLEKGTDKKYGARPLRRALQQELEDSLADAMLENKISFTDNIIASMVNGKVRFDKK